MSARSLDEWIELYRDTLIAMDAMSLESDSRAKAWNAHMDEVQWARLALRSSEQGRAAISAMMFDPNRTVSQCAAGHALEWDEAAARTVLERWVAAETAGSFESGMVLSEFDAGNLRWDWEPNRPRRSPSV